MTKLFLTAAVLLAALAAPAHAQNYVVNVHGIVCEFCAFGVAKKIRKLPFIDAAQLDKGVNVDIENQQVFIAVKDDSALDKAKLFKSIEDGGYQPINIFQLDADGKPGLEL